MTDDGWFRTGDVAAIDDDGFYSIVGRVKDVIRTGGETVAPVEVELALGRPPRTASTSPSSGSRTRSGARSCARRSWCATAPTRPTSTRCARHVGDRLARFKHPRMVVVRRRGAADAGDPSGAAAAAHRADHE